MTCILALDLASVTGWAYGDVQPVHPQPLFVASRGVRFRLPSPVTSGTRAFVNRDGAFFAEVFDFVSHLVNRSHAEVIVFEAPILPRKTSIKTTRKLQGMTAIVEMIGAKRCERCFEASPGEIKKHATGSGGADKRQMIQAARMVGWNPKDDNEADALWLHDYACATFVLADKVRAAEGR